MGTQSGLIPKWIIWWFYLTAIIVTWDATFIMLRPQSMPGGSLHWIWYVYRYYITVDQRYLDVQDSYVFAQSFMNYFEAAFNFIAIAMYYRNSKHTVITAFTVSVMTFWKTVLYVLMFTEFCTGGEYRKGNSAMDEFIIFCLPNFIWVFAPFWAMVVLWPKLTTTNTQHIKHS